MLEAPAIPPAKITACLEQAFGIKPAAVNFLPLGADSNTAVYRVTTRQGPAYFLKIRLGDFDEIAVALPKFYSDQGIRQIIPPLAAANGRLWADLEQYKAILYPFVDGRNGYEVALAASQWTELGAALKRIHGAPVPPALKNGIPQEAYAPQARETVLAHLDQLKSKTFTDPTAVKLAAFLQTKRTLIASIVQRAAQLAAHIQNKPQALVVCHSDLHAGNVLVTADGSLYIIDWDNPIQALKERDLMYVGGAQGFCGHTAEEEIDLFYLGYGKVPVRAEALAYYRYERIIQDIAIYCDQLLLTTQGGEDREQSYQYLVSNFLPNGTIEAAYRAEQFSRHQLA